MGNDHKYSDLYEATVNRLAEDMPLYPNPEAQNAAYLCLIAGYAAAIADYIKDISETLKEKEKEDAT